MAHSLTSGMLTQTQAKSLMPIIFCEIDTTGGNVYAWTGIGTIVWNSITWTGLGNLVALSAVTEAAAIQASGVSLTLNGVPSASVSIALSSLQRFKPVKLWLGALDSSFAVVADPYQFFNGRCDRCEINDSGDTATITLTAESRLISMKVPRERRYTDHDQRIERPYDGGFKFVDFVITRQVPWGATAAAATSSASTAAASGTKYPGPNVMGRF